MAQTRRRVKHVISMTFLKFLLFPRSVVFGFGDLLHIARLFESAEARHVRKTIEFPHLLIVEKNVESSETQHVRKDNRKTTKLDVQLSSTRLTQATVFYNLCRDQHETQKRTNQKENTENLRGRVTERDCFLGR